MTVARAGDAPPIWPGFVAAAAVHLLLALAACFLAGVSIDAQPARGSWNDFWQGIPVALLAQRPLESIWHLHSQPPLYNLYGALLVALFGDGHLAALHALHVLLGALISGMCAVILRALGCNARMAVVAAIFLAASPSLVLYEAYPLYVVPTAFLATSAVFMLALWQRRPSTAALGGLAISMALLCLLWSAFHLVLALAAAAFAGLLARSGRVLAICLLATAPVAGWYGKNLPQHGFFGASSWFGQSLFRAVSARRDPAELRELASRGVITAMVASIPPFAKPSRYAAHGYQAGSPIAVLAADDRHNVNVPAISRAYGRDAWRLLRHDPVHYAGNVGDGLLRFASPSWSLVSHVGVNTRRLGPSTVLWGDVLLAGGLARALGLPVGTPVLVLLLGILGGNIVAAARAGGTSLAGFSELLRRHPARTAALVLVAYATAAGCLLEHGENARFKVAVEPLLLALAVASAADVLRSIRGGRAGR